MRKVKDCVNREWHGSFGRLVDTQNPLQVHTISDSYSCRVKPVISKITIECSSHRENRMCIFMCSECFWCVYSFSVYWWRVHEWLVMMENV